MRAHLWLGNRKRSTEFWAVARLNRDRLKRRWSSLPSWLTVASSSSIKRPRMAILPASSSGLTRGIVA